MSIPKITDPAQLELLDRVKLMWCEVVEVIRGDRPHLDMEALTELLCAVTARCEGDRHIWFHRKLIGLQDYVSPSTCLCGVREGNPYVGLTSSEIWAQIQADHL